MANRAASEIVFWGKHLALALALIVVAAVVISLQDLKVEAPTPEGKEEKQSPAGGMSKFYAQYRLSSSKPHEEEISDFVMSVNTDARPLTERLKSMEKNQNPVSGRWEGEHKYRTFGEGDTLREAITTFAHNEGMQLMWELEQDFIIKSQFQMDTTLVTSLHKIAKAIDSNFDGDVMSFVCPRQRTLVITAEVSDYLKTNCTQTRG